MARVEPLPAAGDIAARVRHLLGPAPQHVAEVAAHPVHEDADRRIDELMAANGGVTTMIPGSARPGIGGRLVRVAQRAVRRGISWYVDPRWRAQATFNETVTGLATSVDEFRRRVERAEADIATHTAALGVRVMEMSERQGMLEERMQRLDDLERIVVRMTTAPSVDYVAFEERFRGPSSEVREAQREYVERFVSSAVEGVVVDIGCGRGEMLELLREAGVDAVGVDTDEDMLAVCRSKGLTVVGDDGLAWLLQQPDATLRGVFLAQVVEHLLTNDLLELVDAAARKLVPGGAFVAETIDPRSLYATANFFWADLSHVRPVHPATLLFLVEQAGFAEAGVIGRSRHELADLVADDGDADRLTPAVRALLETVYGFQDYAVVAGSMTLNAVNQYHSGTAVGDAITSQMLRWRSNLRELGHRSDIFVEHVHRDLRDEIRPLTSYLGDPGSILIVHHSMGHLQFELLLELPDRKIMAFHNITPERFFDDEYMRRFSRLGHRQLRRFAPHADAAIADSAFNRRELIRAGYRRASIVPVNVPPHPAGVRLGNDRRDWLFVGRMVPSKGQHELVDAFRHHAAVDPEVRLHLVGDTSDRYYVERVAERVRSHGLSHRVLVHGKLSDDDLSRMYASAGVYVSLSQHEGFGVPLLEAMAHEMPVIALARAAVPETLGGSGVLLESDLSEDVAAAVIHASEPTRRAALVEEQLARLGRLQRFDVPAALQRAIDDACGIARPLDVQIQGPFETSYSLAILNRRLALQLDQREEMRVSIFATEGPGDYEPDPVDLARHPGADELFRRSAEVPHPDVVIRQLYPPRVADAPGGVNLLYFGWEESRIPNAYVNDFNRHLDGVGTMSRFVTDSLIASGLTIDARTTGVGVDVLHSDEDGEVLPELQSLPRLRFLNVSSAFPRKGIDVLLAAYFAAFTGADDVTLLLKSFSNPHNDAAEHLARLRAAHLDPPDVRWIDRDITVGQLGSLFEAASYYVHPSRGEGYGLPVAEAMLLGVPVIGLAHSGTADFLDSDVAITVPYTIVPAASHLTVDGGEWAEPDVDALTKLLRRAFDGSFDADEVSRTSAAQRRIADAHSWAAVGDRWASFIEEARDTAFAPNVAMVSTWNSRCGIAEYTRRLVDNMGTRVKVRIHADRDVSIIDDRQEAGVERTWLNRWQPDLGALTDRLVSSDADVVHFQFNFGFFELTHLARLMGALDRHGRAVVITLHATFEPVIDGEHISLTDIARSLQRADRVVVHREQDAARLAAMGVTDNVEIIPMGASVEALPSRIRIRSALGLDDRPIISSFGFALPHKGLLELIRAVGLLTDERPDLALVACCARHDDPSSAAYLERCHDEVERLGLGSRVRLISEFLPELDAQTIVAASNLVVLPYGPTEESASAALRSVIGCGTAVLTTDVEIFRDAADVVEQVPTNAPDVLAAAIGGLIDDDERRRRNAEACADYARRTSWRSIAIQHAALYRDVARARWH